MTDRDEALGVSMATPWKEPGSSKHHEGDTTCEQKPLQWTVRGARGEGDLQENFYWVKH